VLQQVGKERLTAVISTVPKAGVKRAVPRK
jgi:hypothetical protein